MPLTQNVCGERQRDLSCAAFRVERQGDGVILRVIGLRPRDRAKRRAQLRKLCIRFLPDNAAVLRDSLRSVPAVDKNIRYAGAKGAARDQLAAPVARKVERPHAVAPLCIIKAITKGFSRIDEALLRQRIEVTNCHAPALDRFNLKAREAEHIVPRGQSKALGGFMLSQRNAVRLKQHTIRVEQCIACESIILWFIDLQRDGLAADLLGLCEQHGGRFRLLRRQFLYDGLRGTAGKNDAEGKGQQKQRQGELSTHGKLLRLSLCKQHSSRRRKKQVTKR